MSAKIEVLDRVSRYPGRVTLTPVSGATNTFDMVRADEPTTVGTPINKALLDNKAYTLTAAVTVYVTKSGSDTTGDGTSGNPFLTIQKAVNSLPKCLGSYHAQINIGAGTYEERVVIDGFTGGRLTLGVGNAVIVRGISVFSSNYVRINIPTITYSSSIGGTLLYAGAGSDVLVLSALTLNCQSVSINGIGADQGSSLCCSGAVTVYNSWSSAVIALTGAKVYLSSILGSGNTIGLRAESGGVIHYGTRNITATTANSTVTGGRIYTGSQTSVGAY